MRISVDVVRASDVTPVLLPMLWRNRIPAATLTVIAGEPGLGKSTLSGMIAAELSRSGLAVVYSNAEDDLAAVTRPRLEVAGAALDRVHLVPPAAAPTLPNQLAEFEALIVHTRASAVILDPVGAHFSSERRVHDRACLRQLVDVARRRRCAIIAVHHTVKTFIGRTAIGAIGGTAGGLSGTARACYVYGYDPEDEDRRALVCVKINGVDEPPALILEHETIEFATEGTLLEAGKISIVGEAFLDGDNVLRRGKRKRDRDGECSEWLTLFLSAGDDCQRQVSEIQAAAKVAGFGWQTTRRAFTRIKAERIRVGWGGDGFWLWRLPDEHPLREEAAAA